MISYGKIIAVLNTHQVILEIDASHAEDLQVGETLTVFAVASPQSLRDMGLNAVYAPKGKLRIVLQQAGNLFLAETFFEGGRLELRPLTALAGLFTQEVKVGGTWSAQISEKDTLDVTFDADLKHGDIVGVV